MADQKQPAQNASQDVKAARRPKLGYLRSAWTTTDIYYRRQSIKTAQTLAEEEEEEEEEEHENIYQFKLPALQLQDCDEEEGYDEVLREVFRIITLANALCLVSSLSSVALVISTVPAWHYLYDHHDWIPHAILPCYVLWWLFMLLVLKHKTTEHLSQYLNWTQLAAAIMALTHFLNPFQQVPYYNFLFVAIALIAFVMYFFSKSIVVANERKQDRFKRRLLHQQDKLQQVVNQHAEDFNNHKSAFLTTVQQEIQDVALMVITTLEQFSPGSILCNAHELLSACSIAVPIASISAINTTIRQVCHVSSHLKLLSKLTLQAASKQTITLPELVLAEFDIGELLQSLGDALAGVAAKLDVHLVIYHHENSLHHMLVLGDEGAIRHALLNHIRNILECCTPGASIEVGLNVSQIQDPKQLNITFYITHTSSPAIRNASAALLPNANLTAQLLSYIDATCNIESGENKTRFIFSFVLGCGKKEFPDKMFLEQRDGLLLKNHYANIKFSNEPSLKELNTFIENLKGLKMVLHAPEHSIFAKHMTSCLASWNADISHVPVAPRLGEDVASNSSVTSADISDHSSATTPNLESVTAPRAPSTPPVPSPAIEEEHIHSIPPAFILIDDDIATLENKLAEFRAQPPASASALQQALHGRRHHHHYKKSSNSQNFFHQGTTAIIHFTSLTNYKSVRDTIQCYAFLPKSDPFSMPRVVVVPKPAGPRRFLTALHTAWNNSVVEPHFSAIATSPSSPMPPMISMLVQREIANQSPNANSPSGDNAHSPGSTTARRRPVSGIFSPPTDNYFASQQASPSRRRSTNAEGTDYLTAKNSPVPVAIEPVVPLDAVTPLEEDLPPIIPPVVETIEPIVEASEQEVKKKKMGRTMSTFKSQKKKRKEKPFADVVSPPIHVLIVEDNIINQAILSAWMKKHKIKFSVASNGSEAVNKWKTGGFHLILMDIQLPVMNGIEATKMIRSIEKEQQIGVLPMSSSFLRHQQDLAAATAETMMSEKKSPYEIEAVAAEMLAITEKDRNGAPSIFRSPVIIVALTASSLESDRHAALAAGCNDFLTKPVSLEWLEKKIIEWGCMQALIDFEGWRRWKKKSNEETPKRKASAVVLDAQKELMEAERKRIEELSKIPKEGILLPGISNLVKSRRNSVKPRILLKPSKSSDNALLFLQDAGSSKSSLEETKFDT